MMREAPTQIRKKEKINEYNAAISNMRSLQNSGLSTVSHKDIKNLMEKKEKTEKELRLLKQKQSWAKKNRLKRKETLETLR